MNVTSSPETGYQPGDVAIDTAAVLIFDCQTSGAHAQNGHIIEVGWVQSRARHGEGCRGSIETYFVRLPEGIEMPKRVQQVTGIFRHDLDEGITELTAWKKIVCAARDVARLNGTQTCPVVVHFSRFEEPFLRELHQRYTRKKPFPFELVCTHEISRRLFPALPRRGIRALAGFFGHGVRNRRCRDHVAATELIWHELIALLQKKHNIHTLGELVHWLDTTPIHVHVYRSYPMERQKRRYLPDRPGVYRMLRSNGDILYIGKAGSIRKRVNSYFTKRNHHADHILEMLSQAKKIDITETGSVLEAAILESDEIKQHVPPYNRSLQSARRAVWFSTPDLKEFGHTPGPGLTRGPFAHQTAIRSLAAIRDVMEVSGGSWNEETALGAFALPAEYAPDVECVRAGCELFFRQNAAVLKTMPVEHALASLGKKFWLQLKPGADDDNDDDLQSNTRPQEWTPDTVARIVAANVRAGTHALRRAPWLVWLTESTIAWEEVRNSKKQRYLLVFESGEIVHRQQISRTQDIPVPPGYVKKYQARQHSFDLETFDRMRVLQTEMRAILSSGRWFAVRLGPTTVLERSTLARILKWV
jgi:DNA polymerase-3 subunit epsilon